MKKFPKVVVNRRHYFLKYDKNIKVNIKKEKNHQKKTKKQKKSSKVDKLPTKVGRKIGNVILKF